VQTLAAHLLRRGFADHKKCQALFTAAFGRPMP